MAVPGRFIRHLATMLAITAAAGRKLGSRARLKRESGKQRLSQRKADGEEQTGCEKFLHDSFSSIHRSFGKSYFAAGLERKRSVPKLLS